MKTNLKAVPVLAAIILFFAVSVPYAFSHQGEDMDVNECKNADEKPFVIPELKKWERAEGRFEITGKLRISVPEANEELKRIAEAFSTDWETMFGTSPRVMFYDPSRQSANDIGGKGNEIMFRLEDNPALGDEGYIVRIGNRIEVCAPGPKGIFWATRTLLQIADGNGGEIPAERNHNGLAGLCVERFHDGLRKKIHTYGLSAQTCPYHGILQDEYIAGASE